MVCLVGLVFGAAALARKTYNIPTLNFVDRAHSPKPGVGRYTGHVKTKKGFCKGNRDVFVYERKPSGSRQLARTKTVANGDWAAKGQSPGSGHQVNAVVEAKVVNRGGDTYVCKSAASAKRTFPYP